MKTKSFKFKALALLLATILGFGITSPNIIAVNAAETTAQQYDTRYLENYLKSILPKDKTTLLVDNGIGISGTLESEVIKKGNGLLIFRRSKETAEDQSANIATIDANMNGIYPGALLHADSHLVDGVPNIVPDDNLNRKPITVGIDINGNTQDPITVENPNQHTVKAAISKQVNKWLESGQTAAAKMSYRSAMAYDEKQLETEIGVKDAAKTYGVDIKANIAGEKKDMLVCFNQVYYTATVDAKTASYLLGDDITIQDLKNSGITEENPGVVQVTSVDYGRQIVVKLSTNKLTTDVEAAWNASIGNNCIENKNKYKGVMENTVFSVFAYGGSTGTASKLITTTKDIDEVNKIIAADMDFKKGSAACPMSYSTNFIDDGSRATVTKSTEYVKTTVEKREQIEVKTDPGTAYATKHQRFYARPIIGLNEDGTFKLGAWERLMNESTGNQKFYVDGKYAEFGFSFDISWGTDWPYSGVFWKAEQGAVEKIFIEWGGGCRTAWIEITVDDTKIVDNTNCSSHSEYNFGC